MISSLSPRSCSPISFSSRSYFAFISSSSLNSPFLIYIYALFDPRSILDTIIFINCSTFDLSTALYILIISQSISVRFMLLKISSISRNTCKLLASFLIPIVLNTLCLYHDCIITSIS
jgi:hypothetical protein